MNQFFSVHTIKKEGVAIMKRMLFVCLSLIIAVSVVSCGGGKSQKSDSDKTYGDGSRERSSANPMRGQAKGMATIYDNDRALARDRALDDARNKLVEQVLGATVSGEALMKDYELVSILVQSKSYGLVKKEKILQEGAEGDAYMVTIEGTVEPGVVEDAIADALKRYGHPKFMVLINETFEGRLNAPGFTETEIKLQQIMGNSGFEFVDAQMTQDLMKRERQTMGKAMNGQVGEDVQNLLLNTVGAEVLIIGTAQTNDQSAALRQYSQNMRSKSAIVRLKAIDVYTGAIIATTSEQAPGVHIDNDTASKNAIEAVLKKTLGKVDSETKKFKVGPYMDLIIKKFVQAATHRPINVFITGLDYTALKKFRDQVSQRIRGVRQVIERGRVGQAAKLEVQFAGKTNDFTDELLAKQSNMGFIFKIPQNFPNKVYLEASPKQ